MDVLSASREDNKIAWYENDGDENFTDHVISTSGIDPLDTIKEAIKICEKKKNIQILWASTREILNIVQADRAGCHIITVPNDLLKKLSLIGKNLEGYSLETVKGFYDDALSSGFKI